MARFYSARATLDPGKISQWVVEWIEHLDDSHHVFVEFSLPGGRQVDFLLLRESGVYCLEVKDKPYEKVTVNGPWIYRDRSTGCAIEDLNELSENPYGQAKNTADCFRNWLSRKDTAANVFQDRAEKIKRDQYHRFEFLKVFPAVLIPADHPRIEIERDRWCWLCRGTSEITELFKRSWQSSFRITPAEIQRIAETLKLEEVSVLKLVDRSAKGLPRELAGYDAYCRNLIRWLADIDPWHACYVPNPVREAQHPARKSDKPDAEHPQLRTTRDLFPALRHHGRWLIEAEAGVGKTTLCVNICKRAAEEKLSNPDALLPIYVELKDYAPGRLGFPDLIALSLRLCGLDVPGDISHIIEKANLLLLLDGLNEIEERAYPRFLAEARQYLSVMTRSVALMTTRPMHRQRPSLPGLRVIEVSPFGEPQLVDYLQKRDRLDLMEGLARHDINQLLQIPLVMALAVDVGLPFAAAKGLSTGGFFRTLCRDLLHREEQKVGRASAHQMLWDDLAELARQMSADPQLTKGELSKARAIAFMQDRRLDPAVERLQSDLRILIDSRVLRDIVQRDTIAFCHDTIK